MRLLFLVLLLLVGLIQYPLWLGKGGWFKVWDLQKQAAAQREINDGMRARNAALDAEVQDLKNGTGAIEERARGELGMMREGEVYVQILPQNATPPVGASQSLPITPASAQPPAAAKPAAVKPVAAPGVKPAAPAAKPTASPASRPAAAPGAKPATPPASSSASPPASNPASTPAAPARRPANPN
jgi:cell division protein FtsB